MKKIIESISKAVDKKPVTATATGTTVCNYDNNYYGDQICVRR